MSGNHRGGRAARNPGRGVERAAIIVIIAGSWVALGACWAGQWPTRPETVLGFVGLACVAGYLLIARWPQ
jgi:hypothetical protein